jgi:hypothetical protein
MGELKVGLAEPLLGAASQVTESIMVRSALALAPAFLGFRRCMIETE